MVALAPAVFAAYQAAAFNRPYRPTLLLAVAEWESGLQPDIVGDPPNTRTRSDLLALERSQGFAAAVATGHSIGLGQINAIHWTPPLDQWFDPTFNLRFAGDYLEQQYRRHGGDERLAAAAYRGPAMTDINGWLWDRPRTSWIVDRAGQLDAEGVVSLGGEPAGPEAPPAPPPADGGTPPPAGELTVDIDFIELGAAFSDLGAAGARAAAAIRPRS